MEFIIVDLFLSLEIVDSTFKYVFRGNQITRTNVAIVHSLNHRCVKFVHLISNNMLKLCVLILYQESAVVIVWLELRLGKDYVLA